MKCIISAALANATIQMKLIAMSITMRELKAFIVTQGPVLYFYRFYTKKFLHCKDQAHQHCHFLGRRKSIQCDQIQPDIEYSG